MTDGELRLFALHETDELGAAVGVALGRLPAAHEGRDFEDGEHKVRPLETVRGAAYSCCTVCTVGRDPFDLAQLPICQRTISR